MKLLCLLLLLLAGLPGRVPEALAQDRSTSPQEAPRKKKERLVVIVHKANPIQKLTPEQVRRIYLRKDLTWADYVRDIKDLKDFSAKTRIQPVELSRKLDNEAFHELVLDKKREALERYWIKLQYQSAIKRPTRVSTAKRVLRYVASLEGAIGFVRESELSEKVRKHVRVVTTIELPK